ncbi:MAG: helix-turn-helix domain-containing protein [Endomicrobium sp.]|jgi:transcriptional regulator with XRE-family HTH domain|nr:helix-turn-helix domain-containing protein [Endomicrobium sp.]
MTTTQLAKRLEMSRVRVVHIEKNKNNLKISTLNKISIILFQMREEQDGLKAKW